MALGCPVGCETPGEQGRRCDGKSVCGLGVAFACAVGHSETLLQSFKIIKGFRGFRGFRGWQTAGLGRPEEAIDVALGCLLAAKAWRRRTALRWKKCMWLGGSFCLRGWAFRDAFAEFERF